MARAVVKKRNARGRQPKNTMSCRVYRSPICVNQWVATPVSGGQWRYRRSGQGLTGTFNEVPSSLGTTQRSLSSYITHIYVGLFLYVAYLLLGSLSKSNIVNFMNCYTFVLCCFFCYMYIIPNTWRFYLYMYIFDTNHCLWLLKSHSIGGPFLSDKGKGSKILIFFVIIV